MHRLVLVNIRKQPPRDFTWSAAFNKNFKTLHELGPGPETSSTCLKEGRELAATQLRSSLGLAHVRLSALAASCMQCWSKALATINSGARSCMKLCQETLLSGLTSLMVRLQTSESSVTTRSA